MDYGPPKPQKNTEFGFGASSNIDKNRIAGPGTAYLPAKEPNTAYLPVIEPEARSLNTAASEKKERQESFDWKLISFTTIQPEDQPTTEQLPDEAKVTQVITKL